MSDAYEPQRPFIMGGTQPERSFQGPHGGGHGYSQMGLPSNFEIIQPLSGHTQQPNITVPTPLRGYGLPRQ